MSMDFNEVVPQILKRLDRLERALKDKLDAQDIEQMIEERFPQTAPKKGKK